MSGSDPPTREGPLKTASAVIGLLAGVVTAIYVAGGLVLSLRLFFDHFQQDEVVSAVAQLPRETVVTAALLSVFGLAGLVWLIAALISLLSSRPRRRVSRGLSAGRVLGFLALFFLLPLVVSLPALGHAYGQEETSRGWAIFLIGAAVTAGALIGGWYLLGSIGARGWSRGEKALAAGAVWAAVAVIPLVMLASTRPFVSAQVCTAGAELPLQAKLIGESSDRIFLEEEFGNEAAILELPAGQVTRSEYGDLSSTFACPLSPGQKVKAKIAETGLEGHGSKKELALAMQLRPRLLFDRSERWRPVAVDAFLSERFEDGGHRSCGPGHGCRPSGNAAELKPGASTKAYLDIHGDRKDPLDFKAADPACGLQAPVVDCNAGPQAAIYYRRSTHEGRWYWDYWWFLRYNDYADLFDDCNDVMCSDHEGDWEGVTVITTPSRKPVTLGAIYAAHRNRVLVDGSLLPLSGGRPLVFVAAGTHASYPYRCRKHCRQYQRLAGSARLPEDSHDGGAAWGENDDARCLRDTCVRPVPEVEPSDDLALPLAGSWAGWPGLWGETCHWGCNFPLLQSSPRSPGLQVRFECPWAVTDRALPAPDGSGLSDSERVGDSERLFGRCRAQRGGERGLAELDSGA
ncbi:MAG TPA: hypothetical protein VFX35_12965 [Solirubrobacterales bacterium]|nr:hypothetical protein [Solirubrobacterales bacterium]